MSGAPLPLRIGLLAGAPLLMAFGWLMPGLFVTLLPVFVLPILAVAAWEFAGAILVGLVALIAISPEYHAPAGQATTVIALHKGAVIAIVALIIVRRGFSGQFNGPALAFVAGFLLTPLFGTLHPALNPAEMLRSLFGSIAPFVIIWARTGRRWHDPMILVAALSPTISVLAGVMLTITGHRLFGFDQHNVMRLQGAGIPAFLGYLGEIGTFAAFAEYARTGRPRWLWLTAFAYCSIVASGTRVPMATALIFCLIVLCFARGPNFGIQPRLRLWVLGSFGAAIMGVLVGPTLLARTFGSGLTVRQVNFSGRDVIWPIFIAAIERHPLFGQGIGTGRFLAPEDQVRYIGSNAVHNEYLRLSADMGLVGVGLFIIGHIAWLRRDWRVFTQVERTVLVAFGIAFALHCISDNTLIAPQAVILYAWLATFIERARRRGEDAGLLARRHAPLARSVTA
jgi:O-antigen ligase